MKLWMFACLLYISASAAYAGSYQVIILGGGRSEEEAEKAIQDFKGADAPKFSPAKGYPKVFEAEDLPGTPEDTYVAVLGFCDSTTSADVISGAIRAIRTGAFSRAVPGEHPDTCPGISPELLKKPAAKSPKKNAGKKAR